MPFVNYREGSKRNWGTDVDDGKLTLSQVKTGALLRIADATELMAINQREMEYSLNWYKEKHANCIKEIDRLNKSNAALRGHFKRIKNKLNNNS